MSVNTTPMVRFYADTAEAAKEVVRLAYVGGFVPLRSKATVVEGAGLGLPDGWVVRLAVPSSTQSAIWTRKPCADWCTHRVLHDEENSYVHHALQR